MKKLELLYDVVSESERAEREKKGEKSISLTEVNSFLTTSNGGDVEFELASLGGDLDTGLKINERVRSYPGKTIANITGLTASATTVIAAGCDYVKMSSNALYLIHNGWKEVTGNIYDFERAIQDMSKTDAIMVKIYLSEAKKRGKNLTEAKIIELMKNGAWLTAYEAEEYGFVDEVYDPELRIAANVIINDAKNKINDNLLIKLKEKMNIFGSKKDDKSKAYLLPLADGSHLAISAEEPETGVEVAPFGAMTLEDGEYELKDGRKILVNGGVITEVMENKPEEPEAEAGQMIETVAQMLTASEAKIQSMIEAKLKPLQAMVSTHEPPKGAGPKNAPAAKAENDLMSKIEAKQAEIKAEIEKKRKG